MSRSNFERTGIKQAYVSGAGDDSKNYPSIEVTFNGKTVNAVRLESYGSWAVPPVGSLSLVLGTFGRDQVPYAMSNDFRNRPKNLREGEVLQGAFTFGGFSYYQAAQSAFVGDKVYLGSSSVSVLQQIIDVLDSLLVATYPTAVGPTGTITDPSVLTAAKTALESILGSYPSVN